jgi:hypothetical protein
MKTNSLSLILIFLLTAFAFLQPAHAVVPPPDGGYPGFNTAEGQKALFSLTTGVGNAAVGWYSLSSNTDGSFNTSVGAGTLLFNVGDQSTGEGTQNTAIGAAALLFNVTGANNTATGVGALLSNTTGEANTAIGDAALITNTTGSNNTAAGSEALYGNAGGSNNTATGAQALLHNSGGNVNTAVGFEALFSNTTGNTNTAVGVNALSGNTSGGSNTAFGYGAGANVSTGSFNVYIGAGVAGVADEVGHTYISNIASTQQNLSPVTVDLVTGLLGHEFSSARYKDDIRPMENASEALFALKPVTYRYKSEVDKSQQLDYGLIAEEVAKIDPNLAVRDGQGQVQSVRYNAINAMLLNEFLKEHRKVQELEANAVRQRKQIETLTAGLQKVSAQLEMSKPAPQTVLNNQ